MLRGLLPSSGVRELFSFSVQARPDGRKVTWKQALWLGLVRIKGYTVAGKNDNTTDPPPHTHTHTFWVSPWWNLGVWDSSRQKVGGAAPTRDGRATSTGTSTLEYVLNVVMGELPRLALQQLEAQGLWLLGGMWLELHRGVTLRTVVTCDTELDRETIFGVHADCVLGIRLACSVIANIMMEVALFDVGLVGCGVWSMRQQSFPPPNDIHHCIQKQKYATYHIYMSSEQLKHDI